MSMPAAFNRMLAIVLIAVGMVSGRLLAAEPGAPAPSAKIEAGTLEAEKYGQGGHPVILIPGLTGGAWS